MDINTWLTAVTIFFGALTILPKEERTLLKLKFHWTEYVSFAIILIFVIPCMILFPELAYRCPALNEFTTPKGFKPSNIAFGLFYILFLWLITRLVIVRPIGRINQSIVRYFKDLLNELSFPQFYSIFIRYAPARLYKKNWALYRQIIFSRDFLKGVAQSQPSFLNRIWDVINSKKDFKIAFQSFMLNPDSAYYYELKDNDGRDSVSDSSTFLQAVLVDNLIKNRKNGLLYVLSDFTKQHLLNESQKESSVYLQPHAYYHSKAEEGYDLPLYYHVRFIALMYGTAIEHKVNTHPHMHTLYASMIENMIANMRTEDANKHGEYPTNYHWIISEIFSSANRWLEVFTMQSPVEDGDETSPTYPYFDPNSTYLDFIPSCLNFCCQALYKGLEQEKLSMHFVAAKMYYAIFSEYFRHDLKDEMRASIEENILKVVKKQYLPGILKLTLDEKFAMNYPAFKEKEFRGSAAEKKLLLRLWNYLNKYDLL